MPSLGVIGRCLCSSPPVTKSWRGGRGKGERVEEGGEEKRRRGMDGWREGNLEERKVEKNLIVVCLNHPPPPPTS